MVDPESNWALFYKRETSPPRFCEVRWFDSTVWTATGRLQTFGEAKTTDFKSRRATQEGFKDVCRGVIAEGFVLERQWHFDSRHFDFARLTEEIAIGARKAFSAIRAAHPDQDINAFALFSDEDAMTICHVANSKESFELNAEDDAEDMLWNCAEWSFDEGAAHFDIAYRMILAPQRGIPFNMGLAEFRRAVFESCIVAMTQLDAEGFFGIGSVREDVILLFQVSDSDAVEGANERLNTPAIHARYRRWFDS